MDPYEFIPCGFSRLPFKEANRNFCDCASSQCVAVPPIWGFNPMGISGELTPFPSRHICIWHVNSCGCAFAPVLPSVLVRSFLRFDIFTCMFLTSFRVDRALRTVMSIDEWGPVNAVYWVNRPILGCPNCFLLMQVCLHSIGILISYLWISHFLRV